MSISTELAYAGDGEPGADWSTLPASQDGGPPLSTAGSQSPMEALLSLPQVANNRWRLSSLYRR